MDKPIDLQNEFDEEWDDQEGSASWDPTSVEGPSIRASFGWGPDYLEQAREPSAFVPPARPRPYVRHYVLSAPDSHLLSDLDVWGIEHRFPRFITTERFRLRLRDRRSSGPDAFRMTPSEVRESFLRYRVAWQAKSELSSSLTDIVMLPEYQHIIGLGRPAVPLIIEALREKIDHWFWALTAIMGEDHAEGAQSIHEAAERWIEWYDAIINDGYSFH